MKNGLFEILSIFFALIKSKNSWIVLVLLYNNVPWTHIFNRIKYKDERTS